jgi:hypothetical protein
MAWFLKTKPSKKNSLSSKNAFETLKRSQRVLEIRRFSKILVSK